MVQQMTDNFWQAEARSEETRKFIKDIKRLTRRRSSQVMFKLHGCAII